MDLDDIRSYTLFRHQPDGKREMLFHLFARDERIYDNDQSPCPYCEVDGVEVDEATFHANLEEMVGSRPLNRLAWTTISV